MSDPDIPIPATARVKLDRAALVANWSALDRLSGKAKAGAAVKANAYGLGVRDVISCLLAAGCEDFSLPIGRRRARSRT